MPERMGTFLARRTSHGSRRLPMHTGITPCFRHSHRNHSVLPPGPLDLLGPRHLQPAPDGEPGLGGIDHVVHHGVARGDVGIDVLPELVRESDALRVRAFPSSNSARCLRMVMLTIPSGPMTAISAAGHTAR